MHYAHITNNTVDFVLRVPPRNIFDEAYAGEFIEAPEGVEVGWLWDGETLTPPPPEPPVVPSAVTMRQARLALLGAGLLDDIDAAINGLPSLQKEAARIEWEYSQEVQRHNGFVSVLAPMLGLTEAQTDALFIAAAGL